MIEKQPHVSDLFKMKSTPVDKRNSTCQWTIGSFPICLADLIFGIDFFQEDMEMKLSFFVKKTV